MSWYLTQYLECASPKLPHAVDEPFAVEIVKAEDVFEAMKALDIGYSPQCTNPSEVTLIHLAPVIRALQDKGWIIVPPGLPKGEMLQ